VIVNQVELFKDSEQDLFLESIGSLSRRTTLIMMAEELDHRKRFYKTLRNEVCVAEFAKLKGIALERWSEAYVRKQGYRISSAAIKKIVDLAGPDLQNLAMELDKLLLYAGTTQNVPDGAVDDLVNGSRQQSVFELIDAVARRDRGGALRSLSNLLSMGEHPLVVVSMMARHCRQMMITQEHILQGSPAREIGSAAQIPPFILDQFIRQARSADSSSIRKMFLRLAEIDRLLKSSSADGRMLLESLICALV
jgi:DNA polymerase-3 subunit delta